MTTNTDSDDIVRVRYTKWGDQPHWTFDAVRLGSDEYGVWVQVPLGTSQAKPGTEITAERHHVILFPHDQPFTAAFYRPLPHDDGQQIAVYVDITTHPKWQGNDVTMVDLDLDVVVTGDDRVKVDDEDEFAEHQVLFNYPTSVIELAKASCAARLREVREGHEPFGEVAATWLAR